MHKNNSNIVCPTNKKLFTKMLKAEILIRSFNRTAVWNIPKRNWLLRRLFGSIDGSPYFLQIPFHCSYGYNIHIGKNFFSNYNCALMDQAEIHIGDNVMLAPNVTITTVNHPLIANERRVFPTKNSFHPSKKGNWEVTAPITIGDDVWIGTGAIILPGVTIGDNSIIGAGSVVTHDIPSNVLAYGVPCKVVREITEEDRIGLPTNNE